MDDVLSRAPMFAALDPEAAAALRSSMDTVNLNKGQVLLNAVSGSTSSPTAR